MKVLDPDDIPHPAFGLAQDYDRLDTHTHTHRRPQLLYCVSGSLRLRTPTRVAVLPPQRAAWIGGDTPHAVVATRPVQLRTVYLPPDAQPGLWVFEAPPLLREMSLQACAWGTDPPLPAAPFFAAFTSLLQGWRQQEVPCALPAAQSPALARALDRLLDRLDRPEPLESAARAAGLSLRTLQRRCQQELGLCAQDWLTRARMLRALELLADGRLSVGEVAVRCGYASNAAFTHAFVRELGSPPNRWRGLYSSPT